MLMKNKSLLLLLAASVLVLGGCGKKKGGESEPKSDESQQESESTPGGETINHQDPFVSTITDPSTLRNFDARFDEMVDDFTGENTNGTTTGSLHASTLRVLVDSNDANEPKSPDASIYKVGTGVHDIDKFDGIGFRMRMVGNKALKLSNLVLGLRGGDGYNVYPVKLSDALDPDGDALPALSETFQDFIISPQQSIEDANTVYTNKEDGTPSELKVLDEILGIHLYALDEECSAVIEIEEVFLTKAGEKTTMDAFDRAAVNKTDDTCWWRDSTGFIVRKGLTLKDGQTYTAPAMNDTYANVVLTLSGATSDAKLKVGTTEVNWSALKDDQGGAVSNAVNGGFYSFVINAEQSGLGDITNGFTLTSTAELNVAEVFYTNLEVPAPVAEYPTVDVNSLFMFDNFQRTQSGFNGDYDAAIADQKTIDAGLSYQLSYNNGDKVAVDEGALIFDATELAASDYINYKACNDNLAGSYDYMIMALKAQEGATVNDFRFNIGNGVTYVNQMYSAEGLKVATLDQEGYPYIRAGYTWLIIDLAVSGMERGTEPFIDYYYSGTGKLLVDFVAFANAEKDELQENLYVEKSYADGAGYDYAGYVYSPATSRYIKMVAETTGTIDSIRFEGVTTQWFHDENIKDADGNVISSDSGSGTYVIDLVASGIKAEGTEQGIHVHGEGANGAITIKVYSLDVKAKTIDTLYVEKTYEDGAGYDYAGYVYSPATSRYAKMVIETTGTIDSIRFEGATTQWFHDEKIKDADGNVISSDSGSGTYVIDLVASEIKADNTDQGIHVHGDGGNGAVNVKIYSVDLLPSFSDVETIQGASANLGGYAYVGGMDNFGASYLVLTIKSTDTGVDLRSLRIESGEVTAWVKDGAVMDADGNAIARDTLVTTEGITLVIDLVASNLTGPAIHIHAGGFEESAGTITLDAALRFSTNSYGHLLAAVNR